MTYTKRIYGPRVCSECPTRAKAHGLCDKHYRHAREAGTIVVAPRKTEWERFWEKVEIGDCWEWLAVRTTHGYGQFMRSGPGSRLAHRWTWETLVGPVPEGLDLDHLCRNRACCNPDHLEPVTRRVNQLRGATTVAAAFKATHCQHGHAWTPENSGVQDGTGRYCRPCKRERSRAYYWRKKAARSAVSQVVSDLSLPDEES
jgi:hypothetical protein